MENAINLQHYYFPWELEATVRDFVGYYNNERYHEAIEDVTSASAYFGSQYEVLTERSKIKHRTMERRRKAHLAAKAAEAENRTCLLAKCDCCQKCFDDLHRDDQPCPTAAAPASPVAVTSGPARPSDVFESHSAHEARDLSVGNGDLPTRRVPCRP